MAAYAITIFIGAFLLFLGQPLLGKYILPWYGGSSGVWTTCMLFFQILLVAGYAYAHWSSRCLKPRAQVILHMTLVVAALALLPITPSNSWKPADDGNPVAQILELLLATIGLPYLVLASTSPLLQRWLSQIHPDAQPFRLYALSNAASLLALLGFPFFFEPHFTRAGIARLWGWGLCAYAAGCCFCAIKFWRAAASGKTLPAGKEEHPDSVRAKFPQKIFWLLLPACTSMLLLAITNKICQEVAVIPFLWVLPLSLYLLSFAICFDSPRWYRRGPFGLALVASMAGICHVLSEGTHVSVPLQIGVYCAGLFISCMVCHGELYRLRPEPSLLTGYYLAIGVGGALGGFFVAVIAPLIFTDYYELDWGLFLCGLLFLVLVLREPDSTQPGQRRPTGSLRLRRALVGTVLGAGLCALSISLWRHAQRLDNVVHRSRNFYGVLAVLKYGDDPSRGQCLLLLHGRTVHGLQLTDPQRSLWPTLYYSQKSGVGLAIGVLPPGPCRIGLVGLGVGTLATYAQRGDYLRVYEINPEVRQFAESDFTFLTNCAGTLEFTPGDARLSLEREKDQNFDLLVLDAFSDDTIPVHLLTREAFEIYERHLKTNGIIAVHISSESVNLEPVLANVARQFHLNSMTVDYVPRPEQHWLGSSVWVLLSHSEVITRDPALRQASRPPLTNSIALRLWTDDFASLFQILNFGADNFLDPQELQAETDLARQLDQPGSPAETMAGYRRVLEHRPNSPVLLNRLAFLLATTSDPALRDPQTAITLGEKACALTHYHIPYMVSTLAAVYSEAGRFDDAVETEQKSCYLISEAGQPISTEENQLLQFYRSGRPYHEFPGATVQNGSGVWK